MNWFKLYVGDYQRDTGALSLTEHGVYFVMLQHHYATEKPLPKGKDLYRLLRCETKADRDAVDSITSKFWTESDAGWVNARATLEMERAEHQRTVNKAVGKLGGRPKKTESDTESVSERKPNNNPNQTPDTRETKPPEPDGSLEAIWSEGVSILAASKMAPSTARSFIGMLCKRFYPNDVADAIQASAGKADPKAYIQAVLKTKPAKGAAPRAVFD